VTGVSAKVSLPTCTHRDVGQMGWLTGICTLLRWSHSRLRLMCRCLPGMRPLKSALRLAVRSPSSFGVPLEYRIQWAGKLSFSDCRTRFLWNVVRGSTLLRFNVCCVWCLLFLVVFCTLYFVDVTSWQRNHPQGPESQHGDDCRPRLRSWPRFPLLAPTRDSFSGAVGGLSVARVSDRGCLAEV